MQMGEPAGIGFFVHQRIVGLSGAEAMTPDLHRAMVVVELDIEEAVAVDAPDHAAVGLLDQVIAVGPVSPVADPDRKVFRTLGVGAPGMESMVGRMPARAEFEVVVPG